MTELYEILTDTCDRNNTIEFAENKDLVLDKII